MELVYKNIHKHLIIKVVIYYLKKLDMVSLFQTMVILIRVNFNMIDNMGKENLILGMEIHIKANIFKDNFMGRENKLSWANTTIRATGNMVKKRVKENMFLIADNNL